jgi:hypothetical protein
MRLKNCRENIFAFLIVSAVVTTIFFIAVSSIHAGSQTVSSTLASSIIDQARKYLNDPTDYGDTAESMIWSDAEMLQWVNDGTMDIVSKTHCLEDVETILLVESQTSYGLASPFIVMTDVVYNNNKSLVPSSIKDIGHMPGMTQGDELGEPAYWAAWGNHVHVNPAPDSDAAGNELDVYVIDRPTDVGGTENVLVPAQYDRALVYYVTAQALKKDNRPGAAAAFIAEYMAELDRYRVDLNVQPKQKPE